MLIIIRIIYLILCYIFVFEVIDCDDILDESRQIDVSKTKIWGPGLTPDLVILPVRYFFIQAIDGSGNK